MDKEKLIKDFWYYSISRQKAVKFVEIYTTINSSPNYEKCYIVFWYYDDASGLVKLGGAYVDATDLMDTEKNPL